MLWITLTIVTTATIAMDVTAILMDALMDVLIAKTVVNVVATLTDALVDVLTVTDTNASKAFSHIERFIIIITYTVELKTAPLNI